MQKCFWQIISVRHHKQPSEEKYNKTQEKFGPLMSVNVTRSYFYHPICHKTFTPCKGQLVFSNGVKKGKKEKM